MVKNGNCLDLIPNIPNNSVHLLLTDPPYGIALDDWDVLHNNTNSALLGSSPAQEGKSGFKRRGKPINGWSSADRNIGREYEEWCYSWASLCFPKMKEGASALVFGARRTIHRLINAFEDSGFLLKDVLAWKKPNAHHRAQKLNIVLERRGLQDELQKWEGWRLGNLAPIYEPIAWFFKPYKITVTDNLLENEVGAVNMEICKKYGQSATNLLEFGFSKDEDHWHEAQKPVNLISYLIELTTREGHTVLDPFLGSGTTAVACKSLNREIIGFEMSEDYYEKILNRLNF